MIRVLVVAASPLVRAGLSAVLTTDSKIMVVGSTADLNNVLTREIRQLQPDVVLLDLSSYAQKWDWEKLLPNQEETYSCAWLLITDELDSLHLTEALRFGVRGILPQTSSESEIIAAVESVALGLIVLHPDVLESLLSVKDSIRDTSLGNSIQALTPREIEVLEMLASGLANKAIAKRLQISEHTVKFHISSIFHKLGVSTRTQAVSVGVRFGLIML
ncbi:LuxR C-terminal-related transcriptional regulator [Chlorogloeopsis fritschii PCC 9212]|uniref:Helix-turn-helix transcriptional regulator n=1 Tax=Chlorogloeopsis fritschii PCC 6912 TaxID=211165 RepID=A0A433NKC4_CHLFR|nr:response regulator transcription factor [Chlorogloeopsis fritschii]MBF2004922.1 response regulator transcription factor [Chlorogloeopsis fritschii C42_A2020_084]RUR83155.1 helix-turn-helix transcriptional regulator [Chlorogloeopsis fritschii PCC 6912]